MTASTNQPQIENEAKKQVSYKYWILLAIGFWLLFLNGWTNIQTALGDYSIKSSAQQVIRGIGVLAGSSETVVTDSTGNRIDIPNLDGVTIPDLITDPSTSNVGRERLPELTDPNINNASNTAANATAIPTQPQAGGSSNMNGNAIYHGDLPEAVITNKEPSDRVVPRGLPDAAKMPTASPYPTWPARTPIATSEYTFANLSRPGSPYYCVQVPSLGTQSCTADPYILDNSLAQDDLARYLLTGLIQGEPIGTTPH